MVPNLVYWLLLLSFARAIKVALFWIYLWQLKNYHIGRFIDHFRTHKGRQIIFNPLMAWKILLLIGLFVPGFAGPLLYVLLATYGLELLLLIRNLARHTLLKPQRTFKTLLLSASSIGIILVILSGIQFMSPNSDWLVKAVLSFDILLPIIISAVVLLIQPLFVVARSRILKKATQKMAEFKDLTVIGITGSYGKTTTKEFLTTILSQKFRVIATPEHKNSEMGIAETILKEIGERDQIFIVEMGAYKKGGIKLLCDIVKPTMGVVTGVNEQHLATFGSMENLLSAEGGVELSQALPKKAVLFVNGENKYCLDLYKKSQVKNKHIYATHRGVVHADIWAEEVSAHEKSLDFIVRTPKGEVAHFTVPVAGKQNVQNLLGAVAVARELGMTLAEIAAAAKKIRPFQAGITVHQGVHGIHIIDSSYSSNPDGVLADLRHLSVFSGKKVVVMPCLIELGKKSAATHYAIGKEIAKICNMAIITTKDKFTEIQQGAVEAGMNANDIIFCDKPKEIANLITTFCTRNDAVLLEGRVPFEVTKLLLKQ